MKILQIPAQVEYLDQVLKFIKDELAEIGCTKKAIFQMEIAVEEIFVNIAHYAYGKDSGIATIGVETSKDPNIAKVVFSDCGKPYNPLSRPDPDISLSCAERPIGGLGIYMVKKSMDAVKYDHENGKNVLTIHKKLL